jgi:hypothetical protein
VSDEVQNDGAPELVLRPNDKPEGPLELEPTEAKPFRVRAKKLGLPKEWTSGSVSELIEMMEGPFYR